MTATDLGLSPWTFTFVDMRSRQELAVLPLTGVKYTRAVRGAGSLDGYLPLSDPRVRAQDPWGAVVPRKTACYVEYRDPALGVDYPVWGGPVTGRTRSAGSQGMTITCATWESWLAQQLLLKDLRLTAATITETVQALISRAQATTWVGMGVAREGSEVSAPMAHLYKAREVKDVAELLGALEEPTGTPLEYTVDVSRDVAGLFRPTFRFGEPRIGRRYEDAPVELSYPGGGLVDWQLGEDGSNTDNVLNTLGAGSGAAQPFGTVWGRDVGIDEIAAGYPTWFGTMTASDTSNVATIRRRAEKQLRAGRSAELVLSGVRVTPEAYLGKLGPADDVALNISHPSLAEYPAEVSYRTRVLGESVAVGDSGARDQVSLTVGSVA